MLKVGKGGAAEGLTGSVEWLAVKHLRSIIIIVFARSLERQLADQCVLRVV